jgi:alkylation response protein AidB-like acyl-CoA dehydrogenase
MAMTYTTSSYREALRAFLQAEVYPHVAALEQGAIFPREIVQRLGGNGFFAPCVQLGASNGQKLPLNATLFSILVEELAKTLSFGLTLSVSMHVGVFLPLVLRLAHPTIREQIVEGALRGEILGTIGATEAGVAGSDFAGMETSVAVEPDRLIVNGQKHYITNAAVADYVITFARWRPGRSFANFCAVLVPTDRPGIEASRIDMAVMRTAVISAISFDQVALEPVYLLGRKELGLRYFLQHIAVERLSGGVWAAAVAEQCLEEAQRYANDRVVGERSLWSRSAVRHKLAEAVVQVTLLRALVQQSIAHVDRDGLVDPFQSSVIKAAVAPAMEQAIGLCLQLQGARGFESNHPLLRLLNEFRVFGVAGGSTETMLEMIG